MACIPWNDADKKSNKSPTYMIHPTKVVLTKILGLTSMTRVS